METNAPDRTVPVEPAITKEELVKKMVDRFLGWSLPKDFAPDGGVSFTPLNHPNCWPIGTNLLTGEQARMMIEHMLSDDA